MAAHWKPLVVGVCEHAHSTAALRYAADRARRSQEEVVAVHVRRVTTPAVSHFDVTGVQRSWETECEELVFSDIVATLGGRATWRYLSRRGDPARCLAATAVELGARTIVLGDDITQDEAFAHANDVPRRPPAGQRPWLAPVGASRPGAPARAPARAPPC